MRARGAVGLLVVLAAACAHPVHREVREVPVEAGLLVPFVARAPLRWEFGDGSPPAVGAQVAHAFARGGRYVVRGLVDESLREEVTLVVRPRAALHLVPPDAAAALVARDLEALGPAVDFLERLGGADSVEARLDDAPVLGWALEQASGVAASPVDPREGPALFSWAGLEGVRGAVVGVVDGAAALASLGEHLERRAWRASPSPRLEGPRRFERDGRALEAFIDRGALYAVEAAPGALPALMDARVGAGSALGLEADGRVASALDALPSGGLVVFARSPEARSWRFATAAVRLGPGEARLEGRLHADGPMWSAPPVGPSLLSRAPEGPVLVGSASVPPEALVALAAGSPGAPRRKELERELAAHGADVQGVAAAFTGLFELALYVDVPGFVRGTLAAGGRPAPAGTLLLEAPVKQAAPIGALVEALSERWRLGLGSLSSDALRAWRGRAVGQSLEVVLTAQSLFLKAGSPVEDRAPVDLASALSARLEGAFSPGHVSVFLDLAQLRRELLQPRLMTDVDPRRALTAQALAATLLDKLTQLDSALVDLGPAPEGAAVQLVLTLRPKAP